jgi:hypothetical protein
MNGMGTLKAIVKGGKAVIENIGDYPEGTVLELEVVTPEDELNAEELVRLDASLARSRADIAADRTVSKEGLFRRLRTVR